MHTVRVELGKNSYNILIGYDLNYEILKFVKESNFSQKSMLITDSNVERIYAYEIQSLLKRAGLEIAMVSVPAGEISKSWEVAEEILTAAIEYGLDRKSAIFALGGGVVGDLSGFVASIFMRGINFIQIPTSLLAQVDSSVGGKTAVNHELGKNLIGTFYQPKAVFIDVERLSTLLIAERISGLGEIVKYGVIYDEDFFSYLENHIDDINRMEVTAFEYIIKRSCEIKAEVVIKDEKEKDLRRILNFGHTIGHAIEEATHYKDYKHGEAVSIGMIGAAHISRALNRIDDKTFNRLEELIDKLDMPLKAFGCDVEEMFKAIYRDKKTVNGKVNWVLMDSIGKVSIVDDVPDEIVKEAFNYIIK